MSLVLAFDLGGGGLRGGLVDAEGGLRAYAPPRPVSTGAPGGEYDPSRWRAALVEVAQALAAADPAGFAEAAAVAICGFTRTQVFLDADGAPVHPALGWADARAGAVALRLAARAGAAPEAAQINAFHPLARIVWLKENAPAAYARLAAVLEPKDDLIGLLTGAAASDVVSQARLGAARAQGLFEIAEVDPALAPRALAPTQIVGVVRGDAPGVFAPLAGRPVVAGSHDSWAACVGLGALGAGRAYNISGTTEVFGLFSPRPVAVEGLLCVDWGGVSHIGGPAQSGAQALDWAMGVLGRGRDEAAALLAAPRAAQPLLFLPSLAGERAPFWDADLRGACLGLSQSHGPADVALAVVEGVALHLRLLLERAEAGAGLRAGDIRFGGGAARGGVWRRVKADVCGRPILVCEAPEPGLVGVAAAAFVALGRHADLDAAQAAMTRIVETVAPDPRQAAFYAALYAQFLRAHEAVAPLSRALAALARPQG